MILAVAPVLSSSLDEPLRILDEGRRAFRDVYDYECLFVKRERLHGELQAEHAISLKVRARPFSVSMHWPEPRAFAEQVACYVAAATAARCGPAWPACLARWVL